MIKFKNKTNILIGCLSTLILGCSGSPSNLIFVNPGKTVNETVSPKATPNPALSPSPVPAGISNPVGQVGSAGTRNNNPDNIQSSPLPQPQASASYNPNSISNYQNRTPFSREISTSKEGHTGSFLEILNNNVLPLTATFPGDLKLFYASGGADKTGKTINRKLPPSVPNMGDMSFYYEWQYYFVSREKNETYLIRVNYLETIISKEKWDNVDFIAGVYNVTELKTDTSHLAVIVENAVKDKNYIAEKVDKFGSASRAEAYSLPDNRDYSLTLEQSGTEIAWSLYSSDTTDPQFMSQFPSGANGTSSAYESATARVDARTGKILRLTRPTNIYCNHLGT